MQLPTTEIVVFDGVDELDAVGPYEVLAAAGFPVRAVAPPRPGGPDAGPDHVRGANGLTIGVDGVLSATPGLIVVPGGGWLAGSATGARAQVDQGRLPAALAEAHGAGTVIASVCTGGLIVGAAGLLTGRPAVTNRLALADLEAAGAVVHAEARVVDDGDVVTSGGPLAGVDLAIHLVGRWLGAGAADKAAARLEHTPVGPVLVTGGSVG